MAHPLDGARRKVIRAQEHLESLNEALGRYLRKNPYEITLNADGEVVRDSAFAGELPPDLSCLIGDCANNVREALDYVAWELGTKAPTRPLTDKEKRGIAFPIISDKNKFPSAQPVTHLSGLCDVPAATISVIESVQPYHARYWSLGFLPHLVNANKHRELLLCFSAVAGKGKIEFSRGALRGYKDGGFRLGVNLDAPGPGTPEEETLRMKVDGKATIFVTFGDPLMPQLRADLLLGNMIECVAEVIPLFHRFF